MKTFLGQLIIRLRAEGQKEASKLTGAMDRIEARAKSLNGMNWGASFQRNLDKLRLAPAQIRQVETSWTRLQDAMAGKSGRTRRAAAAEWRSSWTAALAAQKLQLDQHHAAIEAATLRHGRRMGQLVRAGFYMTGGGTALYAGGMAGREAMLAASRRSAVDADLYMKGLSDGDRGKIEARAAELSGSYGVSETAGREVLGDAAMNMKNVDAALATGDAQMKAYKLLANKYGAESAIGMMRQFNKGMDNLNVDDADLYERLLDNTMRASQVAGADFNPGDLAHLIKYARSPGKFYDKDFLTQWAPFVAAATGASDSGTQLRAAWDQFATGKAHKNALKAQRKYGLRDAKTDKLVGLDEFAANPIKWMNDYLKPIMEKQGIDLDSPEFATAIGEMSSNRLASDFAANAIKSWEQMLRLVGYSTKAKGLGGADELGDMSLGASFDGLKAAFDDFATALIPAQTVIIPTMNAIADGIRGLTSAAKDNPILTALGIGAGGLAGYQAGKFAVGSALDMFGLKGSAIALDGSAAALTRAAVALGGAGVAGDIPGGKGGGKGKGLFGRFSWMALLSFLISAHKLPEDEEARVLTNLRIGRSRAGIAERDREETAWNPRVRDVLSGRDDFGGSREQMFGEIEQKAKEAESALQMNGAVSMDSSGIDAAIAKAKQLLAIISQVGPAALAAQSAVEAQMRRNSADYGVTP